MWLYLASIYIYIYIEAENYDLHTLLKINKILINGVVNI